MKDLITLIAQLVTRFVAEIVGRVYYVIAYMIAAHPQNKQNLWLFFWIYVVIGLFFLTGDS